MKIVLCTGGYDPLHSGHIAYFKAARALGDMLIVGLNSDEWLERKKGRAFMPWNERLCIVNNLQMVDEVFTFDDADGSARNFIKQVRAHYPVAQLIFANGGDRTASNIPEMDVEDANLTFEFAVGGADKKNSSSWILRDAVANRTEERVWGKFADLYTTTGCKVKELVIKPNTGISFQRHFNRSEIWYVRSGEGFVKYSVSDPNDTTTVKLFKNDIFVVQKEMWHQLYNESDNDLIIVEIQYGTETNEEDIERLYYYGH